MIEIIPNWHPLFVHFSVSLLGLSVLFFILEKPIHETIMGDNFLIFARYSLILGVAITFFTVIAGWSAYNSVDHDNQSHLAMTDHRNWALATFGLFVLAAIWLSLSPRLKEGASIIFILYLSVATALLGVTGFKGAELVYHYGLGVKSLPNKNAHDHTDGHAHKHDDVSHDTQVDDDMGMESMSLDEVGEKEATLKDSPVEHEEDGITRQRLEP